MYITLCVMQTLCICNKQEKNKEENILFHSFEVFTHCGTEGMVEQVSWLHCIEEAQKIPMLMPSWIYSEVHFTNNQVDNQD